MTNLLQIQTQSLKYFWLEECIDGDNVFVAGTYQKILARIAIPALEGAESGETLFFDEVVMTAPLGWLKRNKHAFEPELPQRLTRAIDAIGYGHLDKVSLLPNTRYLCH